MKTLAQKAIETINQTRQQGNTTGLLHAVKQTGGTLLVHNNGFARTVNRYMWNEDVPVACSLNVEMHPLQTAPVFFDNALVYRIARQAVASDEDNQQLKKEVDRLQEQLDNFERVMAQTESHYQNACVKLEEELEHARKEINININIH